MALAGPREQLSRQASPLIPAAEPWSNLIVIPETPQLKVGFHGTCQRCELTTIYRCKGIMTVLRDRSTSREDFIFFVDRLATYLIEKAMEHLPHKPRSVITPIDVEYQGQELDANVCLLVPYTCDEDS